MSSLTRALSGLLGRLRRGPQRWTVVRRGERDPIPWMLRLSILRRDDYRCQTCGHRDPTAVTLELDHCMPWSAGGTDDSTNLRVLCSRCNRRRSNFDDGAELVRRLPTTWWCMTCWSVDPEPRRPWADGTDLGAAPLVREPLVLAWCAWCWATDYTDRPLIA